MFCPGSLFLHWLTQHKAFLVCHPSLTADGEELGGHHRSHGQQWRLGKGGRRWFGITASVFQVTVMPDRALLSWRWWTPPCWWKQWVMACPFPIAVLSQPSSFSPFTLPLLSLTGGVSEGLCRAELPAGLSPQSLHIVPLGCCASQLLHFCVSVELALSTQCCWC